MRPPSVDPRALVAAALVLASACGGGGEPPIEVSGPDLAAGAEVPERITCTGEDATPVLRWSGGPEDVAGWAVVVEDADGARGTSTSWLVTGLGADVREVGPELPPGAVASLSSVGRAGWNGPCPPAGESHRIRFRVHALRTPLALAPATPAADGRRRVEAATAAVGELEARAVGR